MQSYEEAFAKIRPRRCAPCRSRAAPAGRRAPPARLPRPPPEARRPLSPPWPSPAPAGDSDIDELVKQFIENEDQNFKMFNYLNELTSEIEKGEEALAELKLESDKFKGADKGAASQRKRLVKDLQERVEEVEGRTRALDEYNKHTTGTIAQVSRSIEGLCAKLGANTTLLQEMGAEGGANESNLMVYLGVLEQRANELLSGYPRSAPAAATAAATTSRGSPGASKWAARGPAHAAGRRRRLDRGADDGRRVRE